MPSLIELVQEYKNDSLLTIAPKPDELDVLLDRYARSKGLTIQEILNVNMEEFKKVKEDVSPYDEFLSYLQENIGEVREQLQRFASPARQAAEERRVHAPREPTRPRPPVPEYEIDGRPSEGGRPSIGIRKKTRRRKSKWLRKKRKSTKRFVR